MNKCRIESLQHNRAEEGGAGGLAMLLEGVSDSTDKVKRIFGMHVWPWLPTGSFGMKSGVGLIPV